MINIIAAISRGVESSTDDSNANLEFSILPSSVSSCEDYGYKTIASMSHCNKAVDALMHESTISQHAPSRTISGVPSSELSKEPRGCFLQVQRNFATRGEFH